MNQVWFMGYWQLKQAEPMSYESGLVHEILAAHEVDF
jgi:hypothetical protein